MTPLIQLFFDYEEAIALYVETRQEACRLRALTLRRAILDRSIHCPGCAEQIFAPGQLAAPAWLAGSEKY